MILSIPLYRGAQLETAGRCGSNSPARVSHPVPDRIKNQSDLEAAARSRRSGQNANSIPAARAGPATIRWGRVGMGGDGIRSFPSSFQ